MNPQLILILLLIFFVVAIAVVFLNDKPIPSSNALTTNTITKPANSTTLPNKIAPPANSITPTNTITPANTIIPTNSIAPANTITPSNTIPTNTISPSNTITTTKQESNSLIPNSLPITEVTTYLIVPTAILPHSFRAIYIPIQTTNQTTINYICKYMPYGYQSIAYQTSPDSLNFNSPYTLAGQLQLTNLGKTLINTNKNVTAFCN